MASDRLSEYPHLSGGVHTHLARPPATTGAQILLAIVIQGEHPFTLNIIPLNLWLRRNQAVAVVGESGYRLPPLEPFERDADSLCGFEVRSERRISSEAAGEKGTFVPPPAP